jgi:hypothetical protein
MITKSVLIGICALMSTLVHSKSDFSSTIDFQTFELDGHVHDILWCGANDETILVHTDDGGIFRSRDRGANWKRLKTLMQKQGQAVADVDQDVSSFFLVNLLQKDWKSPQGCAESGRRSADCLPR